MYSVQGTTVSLPECSTVIGMRLTATVSRIACTTTETYVYIIGFNSALKNKMGHQMDADGKLRQGTWQVDGGQLFSGCYDAAASAHG